MKDSVIEVHNGIRFKAEAVPRGDLFVGRFVLLDSKAAGTHGTDDSYRPTPDNAWATPEEAVTYAVESAHHAIEGILRFTEGQPRWA